MKEKRCCTLTEKAFNCTKALKQMDFEDMTSKYISMTIKDNRTTLEATIERIAKI